MFYVLRNESTAARRRVPILLTDAATGTTAQSGVALTNIYSYVNSNGGAFSGGAGTVANSGFGQYYYEFHPGEIGTLGLAGIHITAAGCRDYDAITQIAAFDLYSASAGGGISAYDVWNFDPTAMTSPQAGAILTDIQTDTNSIITDIGNVPNNVWASDVSGYTNPGEAGFELTQAASGAGLTAGEVADAVWNATTSSYSTNGTFGLNTLRSDNAGVAGTVSLWTGGAFSGVFADAYRIDESYVAATALKDILTGIGASITGNITGNITGDLSGSVGSVTADVNVSTASMSGIAGTVWNTDVSAFTSPSAGFDVHNGAAGAGISAYDVWNFVLSNTDTAEVNLVAASAGGGITAGEVANAVWNAQLATYATPATGEVFSTDTYGTKIARTIVQNRPAAIDTSQRITSVVSALNANVITATSIQAAAITSAKFATDAITSTVIAADAITSAELAPSANTEIADAVWAYATRNITGGTITTVSDKTGYSLSGSQTFDLTGNITGNLSGSVGSVTTISNGAISASSFLAGAIDASAVASDAVTEIANGVWSVGTRTITGGTITTVSDKTGYSLSGTQSFNLTGNITGNLSGSVGSVSGAVGSVTGAVGSVTAPVSITTTSMSGIAGTVWNTDISAFTNPSAGYSLAVAGSGGVSAADVWSYNGGRTITGGIADTVTTVSGNVLGSVFFIVDDVTLSAGTQASIANSVWSTLTAPYTTHATFGHQVLRSDNAATIGEVTLHQSGGSKRVDADVHAFVNNTASATAMLNILTGIGSSITGNITGNLSGSVGSVSGNVTGSVGSVVGAVGSVTSPVSVSTTSMSGIAGTVWTYGSRTLTSGAAITAGDVWTYNISAITTAGTAGKKLNDASTGGTMVQIVNGPYTLTSTAEGTDGRLDILQDSVQTIELQLVNAFGSAIDIAANFTVSVDIYDESGALTTSYVPTINYAVGGILSFDLDTDVTGVLGRYTIVVSLTDGDVIQVGPLQVLVRPL